jgi:hypothetical protein
METCYKVEAPEERDEVVTGVSRAAFEAMRRVFEEHHFYLAENNTVCREPTGKEKGVLPMSREHAITNLTPAFGFDVQIGKHRYRESFVKIWLEQPGRRTISRMVFRPDMDEGPDEYNLFKGFNGKKLVEAGTPPNPAGVARFMEVTLSLCGGNQKVCDYLLRWVAHMWLKPLDRPGVIPVFVSTLQGCGKDLWAWFVGVMLLGDLLYRETSNAPLDLFGNHARIMEGALFIKLEEMDGCDNRKYANRLKAAATQRTTMINPKGKDAYEVETFARIVGNSNDGVPVKKETGDRRYLLLFCSHARIGHRKYWNETVALLKDPGTAAGVWTALSELDLEGWDVRDLPRTAGGDMLEENEMPYEQMFLVHMAAATEETTRKYKNEDLYEAYAQWCIAHRLKPKTMNHYSRTHAGLLSCGWISGARGAKGARYKIVHLDKIRADQPEADGEETDHEADEADEDEAEEAAVVAAPVDVDGPPPFDEDEEEADDDTGGDHDDDDDCDDSVDVYTAFYRQVDEAAQLDAQYAQWRAQEARQGRTHPAERPFVVG